MTMAPTVTVFPKSTPCLIVSESVSQILWSLFLIALEGVTHSIALGANISIDPLHSTLLDTPEELANRVENANLLRLVIGYRTHGHLKADLDPLGIVKGE